MFQYEKNRALFLHDDQIARSWYIHFPDEFKTIKEAEEYIVASLKKEGKEKLHDVPELTRSRVSRLEWHDDPATYTDYCFNTDELNRFIRDNLYKTPTRTAAGSVQGQKIETGIRKQGFYNVRAYEYYLSVFSTVMWVAMNMKTNNDTEIATIALKRVKPQLIEAVNAGEVRQVDKYGYGYLSVGTYREDGLFVDTDIEKWVGETFPLCRLEEVGENDTYEALIEFHDIKDKILKVIKEKGASQPIVLREPDHINLVSVGSYAPVELREEAIIERIFAEAKIPEHVGTSTPEKNVNRRKFIDAAVAVLGFPTDQPLPSPIPKVVRLAARKKNFGAETVMKKIWNESPYSGFDLKK